MTEEWLKNLPPIRGVYKFAEPMNRHIWFNVGGAADVMFLPADIDDLKTFLQNKPQNIPFFVLGCGSNLLVRDGGIFGVVIKLENKNFASVRKEDNRLYCGSGLKNRDLRKYLLQYGIGGLEFLCSIPGSLGGALRTNAGCFGADIASVLDSAEVIDGNGNIFTVTKDEFNFAYRRSNFPADWIIISLVLRGTSKPAAEIEKILAANDAYRKEHQPQNVRTAGSTFKNPAGLRAWELIKNSGAAAFREGGALVSPCHNNFLINDGSATAADIERLGQRITATVKDKTGVSLEWEVKIIGREQLKK